MIFLYYKISMKDNFLVYKRVLPNFIKFFSYIQGNRKTEHIFFKRLFYGITILCYMIVQKLCSTDTS